MRKIREKAQVILELALVFIVFCLFILGIINIWVWGNAQIAGRNNEYEKTRVAAGTDQTPGQAAGYNPSSLTEDEVILRN